MNAAIFYWTKTKNTEKVASAIQSVLRERGYSVHIRKIKDIDRRDLIYNQFEKISKMKLIDKWPGLIDFFDYDLVCVGFPSYGWHPPRPVVYFLKKMHAKYVKNKRIKVGAPKVPGKDALIFCTYSGVHTGINEATPAGKYVGQFFEHIGFTVIDELYVVGEYHGSKENSTMGRLGDIRGRPNEEDLRRVRRDVGLLVK